MAGPGAPRRRVVWMGVALIGMVASGTAAGPPEEEAGGLSVLRREVDRLRRDLARFDSQEAGILDGLERLSLERLLLEEEVRALDLERRTLRQAAAAASRRAAELGERMEREKGYLAASVRRAYKLGRLRHYRAVLEVQDAEGLGGALRYLRTWSRADGERIRQFRAMAEALTREETAREERLLEVRAVEAALAARRDDLERNGAAQSAALQQVEEEREASRQAMVALEEAAGRLEGLLASFSGEQAPVIDGRMVDLLALRGRLPWPAEGEVAVPFGPIRHPRFRTVTPHPGVDLAVDEGTPVRPIFGGRVVFADWFRGYGNTVIVDHGAELTSVYAHLRTMEVQAGDPVGPETSLGNSGSTGSLRGPTLYLEIRRRGVPEDPLRWLAPRP